MEGALVLGGAIVFFFGIIIGVMLATAIITNLRGGDDSC